MKKLFCILAVAALAGACEQKTEVVTPASQTPNPVDATSQGERTKGKSKLSTSTSEKTETKTEEVAEKKDAATEVIATEAAEKKPEADNVLSAATPNP